jgi:hypothetical protein
MSRVFVLTLLGSLGLPNGCTCGASTGGDGGQADAGCSSCTGNDAGQVDSGCQGCTDAGSVGDAGCLICGSDAGVHHYEYVFPMSGSIDVYDLDNGFTRVKSVPVSQLTGVGSILGAVATPVTGMMYVSSGSQGPGTGHVLKYNLATDTVEWAMSYTFDVDSAALSPDGLTLYQATGALSPNGIWEIVDTTIGAVNGSINSGGTGPHDTLVTLDGTKLLMGPRHSNYLVIADTGTHAILQQVGPVASGIRPFTVNGKATLVFINTGGLIGFYVGDTQTGQILFTVTPPGFSTVGSCGGSHGVSLSPDEKELYLVDCSYSYVHVYDVTGLPHAAPTDVADIQLQTTMTGEGWIQHTRDGRYAVVGDCGDVIDTSTRTVAGNLPSLQSTGIFTEVDFQGGAVVFSPLSRNQGGYGTGP